MFLSGTAGAIAAVVVGAMTQPLDVVRTRFQVLGSGKATAYE